MWAHRRCLWARIRRAPCSFGALSTLRPRVLPNPSPGPPGAGETGQRDHARPGRAGVDEDVAVKRVEGRPAVDQELPGRVPLLAGRQGAVDPPDRVDERAHPG